MEEKLIAMPVEQAQELLKSSGYDYTIKIISGGKDEQLLTKYYVVRALQKREDLFELIVTAFKTTI